MKKARKENRFRKRKSIRKKISGVAEKPRLAVFRSSNHIYAQLIDDDASATLASASTLDKEVREKIKYGGNKAAAAEIGKLIAEKAKDKKIQEVVFDRGGFVYHGRVKELAEAARKSGLKF
jgi:large subunit ribosomal protein L18